MSHEHLFGHLHLQDTVNHILGRAGTEMYADNAKAIVWFRNEKRPELDQRLVFRRPLQVWTIHMVICAWRETQGVQDLGKERIPDVETIMCVLCGGVGWFEDGEGNQEDCLVCDMKGYVEVPLESQDG